MPICGNYPTEESVNFSIAMEKVMANGAEIATSKEPTVKSQANNLHEMSTSLSGMLDGFYSVLADMGLGHFDPKPDTDNPQPSDPSLLGTLNETNKIVALQLERLRTAVSELKSQVE